MVPVWYHKTAHQQRFAPNTNTNTITQAARPVAYLPVARRKRGYLIGTDRSTQFATNHLDGGFLNADLR
jgi:hypothetical protein